VTAGDAAVGPPEEALNRLADAAPGAAEPFPPDRKDPPFCSDGNMAPGPADKGEVAAVVVAVVGSVFGSVVVTFGTVVLTGSVVVTFGTVVLTGSVVVIVGSAVVIRAGSADRPGTAVLARKPRRKRGVRAAARFTALEYPIGHITIQFERKRPTEPLCPDRASFGNRSAGPGSSSSPARIEPGTPTSVLKLLRNAEEVVHLAVEPEGDMQPARQW
jgi:hypothetical protein